jgi:hypothetical protein
VAESSKEGSLAGGVCEVSLNHMFDGSGLIDRIGAFFEA